MSKKSEDSASSFEAVYEEGLRLFNSRQIEPALQAFAKAISLNKTDRCAWEMFACCLGNLGRYEESLRAFDRVRQFGHECASCCTNRAVAHLALKQPDEARDALRQALKHDEANVQNWYTLGLILGMSYGSPEEFANEPFDGRHEEAVEAFDRAITIAPNHYPAWYSKGYVLYKLSHSATARARVLASSSASPDFLGRARSCLAKALELKPDFEEARSLLETIG